MPIPVIDPTTGIQTWTVNVDVDFTFAATNTPSSWSATGIPEGMALSSAGRLTGAPVKAKSGGTMILTATNGSGASVPLHVHYWIEPNLISASTGIEIDFDLVTGFVTGPYAAASDWAAYAKLGDLIPLLVGFKKNGELVPVPLALLRFGVKRYNEDRLVPLNDGAVFETVGEFDSTRFRVLANFAQARLKSWLAENTAETTAHMLLLGEIEAVILETPIGGGSPIQAPRSSQTFRLFHERELIPLPA